MKKYIVASFMLFHLSIGHSIDLMNSTMFNLKSRLEDKCKNGASVPFTNEIFSESDQFEKFVKELDALMISKPLDACELLKKTQMLSAASVMPLMRYEKEKQ